MNDCFFCNGPHVSDWPHYLSGVLAVVIVEIVIYLALRAAL